MNRNAPPFILHWDGYYNGKHVKSSVVIECVYTLYIIILFDSILYYKTNKIQKYRRRQETFSKLYNKDSRSSCSDRIFKGTPKLNFKFSDVHTLYTTIRHKGHCNEENGAHKLQLQIKSGTHLSHFNLLLPHVPHTAMKIPYSINDYLISIVLFPTHLFLLSLFKVLQHDILL